MFIENRQKVSKGFDPLLIVIYIILVVVGWMAVFSSCYDPVSFVNIFDIGTAYGKQLIWIGTSVLIAIGILLIDARIYQNYSYHIYIFFLVLMLLVLIVGTEISGAKAWIKVGGFSIQPSEFMKMATALALAKFLNEGKTSSEKRNIWLLSFLIILIPILIVFLQRDTGSALVFFSFIILFYREGMSGRLFLYGAFAIFIFIFTLYFNEIYAIALLIFIFIVTTLISKTDKKKLIKNAFLLGLSIAFVFLVNIAYNHVFQPHQKQRIESMLGKTSDPKGADFNLNQSKIAIGSGGFFGKGYLNGTQTKFDFVPEQSTDFIFCSIGEEWGFIGSFVILSLYLALIIRIILLSERHRNPFVRYYGYGIAGIIFFHFIINIGMTIGLLPIIGIPLPFISYGGSSLWAFTSMLFIFIKLNDS
jgi:rod shape determining protein RodA